MENTKLFPFGKPQEKGKESTEKHWEWLIFFWLIALSGYVYTLRPAENIQDYSQAINTLRSDLDEVRNSALYAEDEVVEQEDSNSDLDSRISDLEFRIDDVESQLP